MNHKKITLTLREILDFNTELNGLTDRVNGNLLSQGIMRQKLPIITKFWLSELRESISTQTDTIVNLINELVRKYGEGEGEQVQIQLTIMDEDNKSIPNPKFAEYNKEAEALLKTEQEINCPEIKIDDFTGVETDEDYPTLYRILRKLL